MPTRTPLLLHILIDRASLQPVTEEINYGVVNPKVQIVSRSCVITSGCFGEGGVEFSQEHKSSHLQRLIFNDPFDFSSGPGEEFNASEATIGCQQG